jgi:hypothetical protein
MNPEYVDLSYRWALVDILLKQEPEEEEDEEEEEEHDEEEDDGDEGYSE